MGKSVRRNRPLTDEEKARYKAAREEFADHPTERELLESGRCFGPVAMDEYIEWRKGAGDVPLTVQLRQALKLCREPVEEIAEASGVDASVIYRFLSGERGIRLETAAKLASHLRLALTLEKVGG
jgi:hypothetical protein